MRGVSKWRRFVWGLFGVVWKSPDEKITLYKSGWVVVSDGISKDALPLTLCSDELIEQIAADLGGGTMRTDTEYAELVDAEFEKWVNSSFGNMLRIKDHPFGRDIRAAFKAGYSAAKAFAHREKGETEWLNTY